MIRSGHGGYVVVEAIVVPVGRHTTNWRVRPTEITQSDSGGGTRYKPVVQDPTWSMEFARDDEFFPEAVGLTKGVELSQIYFKQGEDDAADLCENTLVVEVQKICDNANDVVRVVVQGQGGVVTENVGSP